MTPLPEIAVNPKTDAVLASLGVCLDRMVETQMAAYPSHWTPTDRREAAEQYLFRSKGPSL